MKRRQFLGLAGLTGLAGALPGVSYGFPRLNLEAAPSIEKLTLSEEAWRERLSDDAFYVLRKEGTEPSFSSPLDSEVRDGEYRCAGCDLPLFTSAMKYDSGTGWPSFYTHIEGHLLSKLDFKMIWPRTEYHCARCEGHQGHVFNDGPEPTGLRWCNNGVALRFVPT
ncbi:MAG: peptide-methionine (R)-S-oxide reductase MsrB [Halomonas sp.]|nr:peptide-methionine (R)-S-oxide reductase MsrB [Halomonas sp.]MBR2513132.1 peptide-methionine (R)-S-oxide reductase MsrB [Halomonas sp.]